MDNIATTTLQIDLHRLEPRFAHLRVHNPQRLNTMAQSIERDGQQMPVIAIPFEEKDRWVLIDGYLRLEALHRAGKDLIWVDVWNCPEQVALMAFLGRCQERPWEVIEEAGLVRELSTRFGLSQREIARRVGRDASWVNKRLALINNLPDDLLDGVRQGHVCSWAATNILLPLTRVNTEHAHALLKHLKEESLSTRELKRFFQHYQQANKTNRSRMVEAPGLFLKALYAREESEQADILQSGPEGAWFKDLQVTGHILQRLIRQVPVLFAPNQETLERQRLHAAFDAMKTRVAHLDETIRRHPIHDIPRNSASHPDLGKTGDLATRNQSDHESFPQHGSASVEESESRDPSGESTSPGHRPITTGTLPPVSGQCGPSPGTPSGGASDQDSVQHPNPPGTG